MHSEFELIKTYLAPLANCGDLSIFAVGQGDDCAVLKATSHPLALSIDTQVANIHFFPDMPAEDIAWRGLASALSDLAAMGATPKFYTLALSLPESIDDTWVAGYARGLKELSSKYNISLIGGDTTSSDTLTQTFQVHGFQTGNILKRNSASPGDLIMVSGCLGNAAASLYLKQQKFTQADVIQNAYHRPEPRFDISNRIVNLASSCIDISDGLIADLGHICEASGTGAVLNLECLPLSPEFIAATPSDKQLQLAATGGDDYQLCFTIQPDNLNQLDMSGITVIGYITEGTAVNSFYKNKPITFDNHGFQHR